MEWGSSILEQRFWNRVSVDLDSGCWLWVGARDPKNYGQYGIGWKVWAAHRVAYEAAKGWIPAGLEIDHLCRNPPCVNPDHLEAVTHQENMRRGDAGRISGNLNRAKTHCPQGHPYDVINTYTDSNGYRSCKICRREHLRRWQAHQRI